MIWVFHFLEWKMIFSVIHLVTAADGAEKFYTTANNTGKWMNICNFVSS